MSPPAKPAPRLRPVAVLKALGLVVLVAILVRRVDLESVRATWRGIDASDLAMLSVCFFISWAVRLYKWSWQVRSVGFTFSWPEQLRNFNISMLLGSVTPLRVGEFYRMAALEMPGRAPGERRALAAAVVALEKVYELTCTFLMIALGAALIGVDVRILYVLLLLITGGCVSLLLPLRVPAALEPYVPAWIREHLIGPLTRARDLTPVPGRLFLLALAYLSYLLNLYGGLLVYRAFGDMNAWDFFFRVPLITLLNLLPITIGGIGLREISSMEVFGALGYPESSAAVASSLLFLGANVIPALVVLPFAVIWVAARGRPTRNPEEEDPARLAGEP